MFSSSLNVAHVPACMYLLLLCSCPFFVYFTYSTQCERKFRDQDPVLVYAQVQDSNFGL